MVNSSLEAGNRQRPRDVGRDENVFGRFFDHCDRSEVAEQAAWPNISANLALRNAYQTHLREETKRRYLPLAVRLSYDYHSRLGCRKA